MEVTKRQLAEDEKTLADFNVVCGAKSKGYEDNHVVRAAELKSIKNAIGCLSCGAVSGAGVKHLPQFQRVSVGARSLAWPWWPSLLRATPQASHPCAWAAPLAAASADTLSAPAAFAVKTDDAKISIHIRSY